MYLHSLAGFLQFLAGSRSWVRHLTLTTEELNTIGAKIKNISKTLKEDVLKDRVERHARGEDRLDIEPAQVAAYLEGERPRRASQLLQQLEEGHTISQRDKLDIRNTLCLQLLLTNAKRAGDVTHLRRQSIMNLESEDGKDVEVEVSARSRKEEISK